MRVNLTRGFTWKRVATFFGQHWTRRRAAQGLGASPKAVYGVQGLGLVFYKGFDFQGLFFVHWSAQ